MYQFTLHLHLRCSLYFPLSFVLPALFIVRLPLGIPVLCASICILETGFVLFCFLPKTSWDFDGTMLINQFPKLKEIVGLLWGPPIHAPWPKNSLEAVIWDNCSDPTSQRSLSDLPCCPISCKASIHKFCPCSGFLKSGIVTLKSGSCSSAVLFQSKKSFHNRRANSNILNFLFK